MRIELPPKIDGSHPLAFDIEAGGGLLFIGANGAGKTRLAGWLDKKHGRNALYIPARRDISMPDSYSIHSEEKQFQAIYGNADWGKNIVAIESMKAHRYNEAATAFASNDFQSVLNVLGARHMSEIQKFRDSYDRVSPPQKKLPTVLETAISIWSECLPHLTIQLDRVPEFVVERMANPGRTYKPIDMSDGERGIFYLVAKTLLANDNTLIIIDEPETYVHRSIRGRLWDRLEQIKAKCVFAYLTHDVDFASSRVFVKRIVMQGFDLEGATDRTAGRWAYSEVETDADLPDDLFLTILGSRTNVLLVEGGKGSLDLAIARALYSGYLIEHVQSCGQVIRLTAALNQAKRHHHRQVFGLIDADFRGSEELDRLKARGVASHSFRDIENVIASSDSIAAICKNIGRPNESSAANKKIVDVICRRMRSDKDKFRRALALRRTQVELEKVFASADIANIEVSDLVNMANIKKIEQDSAQEIESALSDPGLDNLLKFVSVRKDNLQPVVAEALGFKNWGILEGSCMGWLRDKEGDAGKLWLEAINKHFPREFSLDRS